MNKDIPTGPETLTPAWLSGVLGREISHVDATRIGEEEGFTGGGLFRLRLSDGTSLIAKLSPSDTKIRAAFAAANGREVMFYQSLAHGLPVPGCAYADFEPETGASVLLLQDMKKFRAHAFVDGIDADDAASVLGSMAQMHAAWWNAPDLSKLSGSDFLEEFPFAKMWEQYPAKVADILPDIVLPEALLWTGDYLADHQHRVFGDLLDRGPLTVLHRDCQADNVMFSGDGSAVLLDWQFMGRGRGTYDVGYALISSMHPKERKREETRLLSDYHAALIRLGVDGYSFEDCWADYRRSVIGKLNVTVMASVMLDNSSVSKRAWRRADLQRLMAFIADHAIAAADFEAAI